MVVPKHWVSRTTPTKKDKVTNFRSGSPVFFIVPVRDEPEVNNTVTDNTQGPSVIEEVPVGLSDLQKRG